MEDKIFGMINVMTSPVRVKISIFAIIAVIALLISDTTVYPLLVLLSALVHELGHIVAVYLCGIKVEEIVMYPFGVDMRIADGVLPYRFDLAISSAGIVANIITATPAMLIASSYTVFFAVASYALAIFNILPARGFDGGRIADSLLYSRLPYDKAQRVSEALSAVGFAILLALTAVSVFYSRCNLSLVFIIAYMLVSACCRDKLQTC